jgi:hypothetical protein
MSREQLTQEMVRCGAVRLRAFIEWRKTRSESICDDCNIYVYILKTYQEKMDDVRQRIMKLEEEEVLREVLVVPNQ